LKHRTAREAEVLVRVSPSDLRIGLKEGLLEEAIAAACDVEVSDVREAHMLLGDIGHTAQLARRRALGKAKLTMFSPVRFMLATPEDTAEALWERAGSSGSVWIEDKYDGIRAQLHHRSGRTELYSRDLHRITDQFPELADAGNTLCSDVIFDGEIIAYAEGRELTFYDLQKRLGRSTPDLFLGGDVPVHFVVFDLLALDGVSLMKRPLADRRRLLDKLALPRLFERIIVRPADSIKAIESELREARSRGNEGLIAKDPSSAYSPGRREFAWLKLKTASATLDVVVVGVERGHGRRSNVLSDYTFAVREDKTGELLTIGRAYSGLTDAEIDELTEHFTANTLEQRGRYRVVRPDTVLEVAFDLVRPSKRHRSGLALRFPRIKAVRRDKTIADIDTLSHAERLVRR
jgi:DNA ligase-1